METEQIVKLDLQEDIKPKLNSEMISSTISMSSSLTSPVDSGVQLLDSESDLTSVMSVSGGCDLDTFSNLENDVENVPSIMNQSADCEKLNEMFDDLISTSEKEEKVDSNKVSLHLQLPEKCKGHVMTKSDIANQNITQYDPGTFSTSAPNQEFLNTYLSKSELYNIENNDSLFNSPKHKPEDVMNVSLNSYELLDYTMANTKSALKVLEEDQMHVSMSEEVNEALVEALKASVLKDLPIEPDVSEIKPLPEILANSEEQIVFRRQRRKKSKSDTPKKRVSFHEDILNSTKIDDIHINHGFITIEPDVSMSFFERGFSKKPDVVKGRYSWAAEGDSPYYTKNQTNREVKSDIYIHTARYSSISSSSSGSISSSIDEEDSPEESNGVIKKEPSLKMPKSSCLKKTKHRKVLDTEIVEEDIGLRKKKSENNLLDANIFGSLKSIFSTSVPLAERGVPEGQEDVTVYSSSHEVTNKIKSRPSSGIFEEIVAPISKLDLAKNNLKLSISDGFYPNYPPNENLPNNIVLCDSNVYEHKGISYSYEYDNFQKSFETQQEKPKSSTVYQMILKEFNFFKRKAKQETKKDIEGEFEFLQASTPIKENPAPEIKDDDSTSSRNTSLNKYASSSAKMDWSDTETTISDFTDSNSKHLHSPKHKIHKANHYALQNFKIESDSKSECDSHPCKSLPNMRGSSSKNSLINRFLRNVTVKKMLDLKLQKKQRGFRKYMGLYVNGVQPNLEMSRSLDRQIEDEIMLNENNKIPRNEEVFKSYVVRFQNDIFRDRNEELVRVFAVSSAYTTSGEHKPLLVVLTNNTIYISGIKQNNTYCNHFVLPYTELNTILIGPSAQTIHLSNYDQDMQCIITTGCGEITNDLIVHLEMAMRKKDIKKPKLPAVKQLNMRDMVNLRKAICKQTTVDKAEEYFHYSIVNLQEYNTDNAETPLGPIKEGPLMFKISETESRWETAYFILKAGVLYMLSSPSHRVPMRVLPLINGACQGARRIFNCPRPHTFQLTVSGSMLHLAAPDEYVASDWLQALVHAASGTYNQKEKIVAQACTLLMTNEHILTVREAFPCNIIQSKHSHDPIKGAQALSCATISDITSFRLPSAEQSWCILEFACREVHESSGDWIVYFATNTELENFISTLEMLWAYHNEGESFPLSTIAEADQLNRKCMDTYKCLQNSWPCLPLNI